MVLVHFEALEQTLRLRLVSGPVDKKFFFLIRNSLYNTVCVHSCSIPVVDIVYTVRSLRGEYNFIGSATPTAQDGH
jgi:hypothetical protein